MPRVGKWAGSPFYRQNREAQEEAAIGPPFLWILSFGGAKESISPSGARTRLKKTVATATHRYIFQYRK
jgi:hypothetical protein